MPVQQHDSLKSHLSLTRRKALNLGMFSMPGFALAGLAGCGRAENKPAEIVDTHYIQKRLDELGIIVPEPSKPVATYTPYRIVNDMVYLAGQGPSLDTQENVTGKLGAGLTLDDGRNAARLTVLNILAQAKAACGGNLDKIAQWVRLTGYVNSAPDFTDQPRVINGASDLLVQIFGDKGLHARAAIGVNALPFNIAVEIEATFQIRR